MIFTISFCLALLTLTAMCGMANAQGLELYPNVHTIGVNLDWVFEPDAEDDDTVIVQYKRRQDEAWRAALPFSRVPGRTCLRTCIFNTEPETEYDVSVEVRPVPATGDYEYVSASTRTRSFPVMPHKSRSLYVAPEGNGTKFDSLQPGKLADAMLEATADDEVVLLSGLYQVGNLLITESVGPGVLRNAYKHNVTLSGGEHMPPSWNETTTPGLFYTVVPESAANVNCVFTMAGRRLYPYAKLDDLRTHTLSCILATPQPCGLDGFWRDPRPSTIIPFELNSPSYRKLFVKFVDNSHPHNAFIVYSKQRTCLTVRSAKNVYIKGLQFRYYGVSPYGTVLTILNSSDVTVDSCIFEYNDRHIAIDDASHHVSILDSYFYDDADWDTYIGKATYEPITPALCYGLTVPSLYPDNDRMMENGGIIFGWNYSGRGAIIRNCSFHGMMDGLKGVAPAVVDSLSAETDIYDCTISGSDDAIEFDGNAANVRMWNNRIRDGAISMAPSLSGPLYVFRNIITDVNTSHATIEGYDTLVAFAGAPFKFTTGDTSKAGCVHLMHNTYVARGDGEGAGFELRVPAKHAAVTSLNNIIVAGKGMAWAYISPVIQQLEAPLELTSDYNSYFTESQVFGTRRSSNPTMLFDDLAGLQAALPYEQHSIQHRPEFLSETASDFRPVPSSSVVDAGIIIPGINEDRFSGEAPDIGAVESVLTSVHGDVRASTLSVFPNPAHDYVTVTCGFESGEGNWSITDLTGHTLLRGTAQVLNASFTIDISTLFVGMYTLVLRRADGMHTVSVVKL